MALAATKPNTNRGMARGLQMKESNLSRTLEGNNPRIANVFTLSQIHRTNFLDYYASFLPADTQSTPPQGYTNPEIVALEDEVISLKDENQALKTENEKLQLAMDTLEKAIALNGSGR